MRHIIINLDELVGERDAARRAVWLANLGYDQAARDAARARLEAAEAAIDAAAEE